MRKVAEKREGVVRGFRVYYREEYVLDNSGDEERKIKCSKCGRLTRICQTKRTPFTTPFGDTVAADIDEMYCACGSHLGTIDNSRDTSYRAPYILLSKDSSIEK